MLVHGAAGGVGTAALQIAKGLGARTIAVVSTDEKERIAREAGADEVLRSDGEWKDEAKALGGVDVVLDPVGGDRFTDSLRSLQARRARSWSSASPAARSPRCASTACCSTTPRWSGPAGAPTSAQRPEVIAETAAALDALIESGHVAPLVGARFGLERGRRRAEADRGSRGDRKGGAGAMSVGRAGVRPDRAADPQQPGDRQRAQPRAGDGARAGGAGAARQRRGRRDPDRRRQGVLRRRRPQLHARRRRGRGRRAAAGDAVPRRRSRRSRRSTRP